MTTHNDAFQQSDAKRSFAWGQLFVGSVLSGFAVWKLGLKATDSQPSAILTGLATTYDEVRDFLSMPFAWAHVDLSAGERSIVLICLVLYAALFRSIWQNSKHPLGVSITLVLLLGALNALPYWTSGTPTYLGLYPWLEETLDVRPVALDFLRLATALAIFMPAFGAALIFFTARSRGEKLSPDVVVFPAFGFFRLILLNVLFTVGWGIALLLLNWATS